MCARAPTYLNHLPNALFSFRRPPAPKKPTNPSVHCSRPSAKPLPAKPPPPKRLEELPIRVIKNPRDQRVPIPIRRRNRRAVRAVPSEALALRLPQKKLNKNIWLGEITTRLIRDRVFRLRDLIKKLLISLSRVDSCQTRLLHLRLRLLVRMRRRLSPVLKKRLTLVNRTKKQRKQTIKKWQSLT